MIESIAVSGVKMEIDETTKKYARRKIGRLDRYLPRHARKSVKVSVTLKQVDLPHNNKYKADVVMHVPDKTLKAHDMAGNVLAAIDIVEAKLAAQLRRYKSESVPHIGRRGVLGRFKRSYAREQE